MFHRGQSQESITGISGALALVAAGACVLCIAAGCGGSVGVNDPERPVVILITLDTTRADHLGCYGATLPYVSPRVDELATEGVLFTSAISQAAVTPVSHASIFTGLNPYNHGLRVMHGVAQNKLVDERVTLAEVLKDVGYDTGAFVSAFPVTEYFGFSQGFEHFDADFGPGASPDSLIGPGGSVNTGAVQRHAGLTTSLALEWMDKRQDPFFLWLHYFDPHDDKTLPPAEVMQGVTFSSDPRAFEQQLDTLGKSLESTIEEWRNAEAEQRDEIFILKQQIKTLESAVEEVKGNLAEERRERFKEIYDLEITYMDAQLGRVFDRLREMGVWDNCIVVLTSDHGEGLGDHDWWTHGVLYQEQVRVPLIVRAPGIAGGKRVDSLVRSIDILPTIGELLSLDSEDLPPVDGVSLAALMRGETDDLHLTAYSDSVNQMVYNFSPEIVDNKNDLLFALVLDGRWKYIRHLREREKSELYDLQSDPNELQNIAGERPEILERANKALREIEFMPYRQLEISKTPQHILDQLKALGYTGNERVDRGSPKGK